MRRIRVGDVDLTLLNGRERRVLIHKDDDHALHGGLPPVVLGVRSEDDLLSLVPALQHIAAGTDGVPPVFGAICVLRHDAEHRERVEQRVMGLVEMEFDHRVAHGDGAVDHREVGLGHRAVDDGVHGEGDIARTQRFAVGEDDVVANGERPHEAVARAEVVGCKVVDEVEVLVGGDEGGLDERLVHVLAASPSDERVEAGGRFARGVHGDDDLRGALRRHDGVGRTARSLTASASGKRRRGGQARACPRR